MRLGRSDLSMQYMISFEAFAITSIIGTQSTSRAFAETLGSLLIHPHSTAMPGSKRLGHGEFGPVRLNVIDFPSFKQSSFCHLKGDSVANLQGMVKERGGWGSSNRSSFHGAASRVIIIGITASS